MTSNNDYDVQIDSDNLDQFYSDGTYGDEPTCGRLVLDGTEVSWIVEDNDGGWDDRFNLLINGSRDFRSRPDAGSIYDAVVSALQERHHPTHCDPDYCDSCLARHRRSVASIVTELRQEGLTVEPSVPVQLKELGL